LLELRERAREKFMARRTLLGVRELSHMLLAICPGKDGYTKVYCTKGQFKNDAA